ncbi:hypothetical protein VE04_06762 [Pseudogymnoascus sp. 24MN13]|nr:hypothetical protein VE04_06762 [Pseudogymnoascus sp. 24MN13]
MSHLPPGFEPADTLPALYVGPDGTIEYPLIIPPHVEFPRATPNRKIEQGPEWPRLHGHSQGQQLVDVSTPSPSVQLQQTNLVSAAPGGGVGPAGLENLPKTVPLPTTYLNHRPLFIRRWRAEQPELERNVRAPNGRRATDAGPTGAVWASADDTGYTSTSSSSSSEPSSDEDEEP